MRANDKNFIKLIRRKQGEGLLYVIGHQVGETVAWDLTKLQKFEQP